MTVPLCKFKTLFTLLKYYGNNLGFLKLTKKNVVWFSWSPAFNAVEPPLGWLVVVSIPEWQVQNISPLVGLYCHEKCPSTHPSIHPSLHSSIHPWTEEQNESKHTSVGVNRNCRVQITVMYRSMHTLWKLYRDYCNKQTLKTKPGKNSHRTSKRIKLFK